MSPLRLRQAARAVILDPADRILLVRFEFPEGMLWACPGGGLEGDETHERAVIRELAEEVGLDDMTVGPCIWTRRHVIAFLNGKWDGQVERFYLVRTDAFEPAPRFTAEQLAAEYVTAERWWTQAEIAEATTAFAPRRLPELLTQLLAEGPPQRPIETGV
jgi:ADP-ribose pyrophosphatase YjhB (NUDIX family)